MKELSKRGSATCPCCGFTTPVASVRRQLQKRQGGANDSRLFTVVTTTTTEQGRSYRLPCKRDLEAARTAGAELERRIVNHHGYFSLIPDEPTPSSNSHRAVSSCHLYGIDTWADLFSSRQALALSTILDLIRKCTVTKASKTQDDFTIAVATCLAMALDKQADSNSSLCSWRSTSQDVGHTFGRQAIPMMWDFVEPNVLGGSTRDWLNAVEGVLKALQSLDKEIHQGKAQLASAILHPLPDDSAQCFFTDPPYYDSVAYADLSDYFYVWLKRTLHGVHTDILVDGLTPKAEQAIVWHPSILAERDQYEQKMRSAMKEGRRILMPTGVGTVVFAHKSTAGWEAQIQAMVGAGWIVTASWPIDTEMSTRMNAAGTASLASSIHPCLSSSREL